MSLFIECKPDETVVHALGVSRQEIEHALGRASVCAQLARRTGVKGMVDEDPHAVPQPYMVSLDEISRKYGVLVFLDKERDNRLIVLSPRLEEWLVQSVKSAGLKMTDYGFQSDNGVQLHGEINQRLKSLEQLIQALVQAQSPRILHLQSLLH